jgi:hypothetical protein
VGFIKAVLKPLTGHNSFVPNWLAAILNPKNTADPKHPDIFSFFAPPFVFTDNF